MDNSIHPRSHSDGNRTKKNTSLAKQVPDTKAHKAHCERHPKDLASSVHLKQR